MALRGEVVPPAVMGDSTDEDVPPVPPLPAGVALQKNIGVENSLAFKANNHTGPTHPTVTHSVISASKIGDGDRLDAAKTEVDRRDGRERDSFGDGSVRGSFTTGGGSLRIRKKKRGVDVEKLLGSIDAVAGGGGGQGRRVGSGRPPY